MSQFSVTNRTILLALSLVCLAACGEELAAQLPTGTATIEYRGQTFSGRPLAWDGKQIALLAHDGRLNLVPAQSPQELQSVSDTFQPYSVKQLSDLLWEQYRDRYAVSTTENFVVVHPWGDAKIWAQPFEVFHMGFMEFFRDNGLELAEPEIPLMAMVLRSRNDFNRSLINEVAIHDARIGGYYSRVTNRITTYDPGGVLRVDNDKWLYTAWPVIHEATHQSAFNTGVHNRFAPPPTWLSEGLATMFEARGFNDRANFPRPTDRINPQRLKSLRKYLDTEDFHAGLLNLIANDKLFQSHPELAYALSWGLSFYLAENKADSYFDFLKQDAQRPNFSVYAAEQRMRDFAKAFGNDFAALEAELNRYYAPNADSTNR